MKHDPNINDREKYIFLLGGHDLEMIEIRKILESNSLKFIDKDLSWGAVLSSYQEHFNDTSFFVGIELVRDVLQPKNYIEIDHHNDKSHLPSSIEQLAELLGIRLDRWQTLVAANDKGYIPAMLAMGASRDETREMRGIRSQMTYKLNKRIYENRQF